MAASRHFFLRGREARAQTHEAGAPCGQANGGVGCDVVTLYDGADIYSPVIGTFSGTDLPAAQVSTQNLMTVRFQTDA